MTIPTAWDDGGELPEIHADHDDHNDGYSDESSHHSDDEVGQKRKKRGKKRRLGMDADPSVQPWMDLLSDSDVLGMDTSAMGMVGFKPNDFLGIDVKNRMTENVVQKGIGASLYGTATTPFSANIANVMERLRGNVGGKALDGALSARHAAAQSDFVSQELTRLSSTVSSTQVSDLLNIGGRFAESPATRLTSPIGAGVGSYLVPAAFRMFEINPDPYGSVIAGRSQFGIIAHNYAMRRNADLLTTMRTRLTSGTVSELTAPWERHMFPILHSFVNRHSAPTFPDPSDLFTTQTSELAQHLLEQVPKDYLGEVKGDLTSLSSIIDRFSTTVEHDFVLSRYLPDELPTRTAPARDSLLDIRNPDEQEVSRALTSKIADLEKQINELRSDNLRYHSEEIHLLRETNAQLLEHNNHLVRQNNRIIQQNNEKSKSIEGLTEQVRHLTEEVAELKRRRLGLWLLALAGGEIFSIILDDAIGEQILYVWGWLLHLAGLT